MAYLCCSQKKDSHVRNFFQASFHISLPTLLFLEKCSANTHSSECCGLFWIKKLQNFLFLFQFLWLMAHSNGKKSIWKFEFMISTYTLFFAHLEFNMVHCGLTAENTSEMCANGHAKNASPKILILYQCYTIYLFEIKSHIINV